MKDCSSSVSSYFLASISERSKVTCCFDQSSPVHSPVHSPDFVVTPTNGGLIYYTFFFLLLRQDCYTYNLRIGHGLV